MRSPLPASPVISLVISLATGLLPVPPTPTGAHAVGGHGGPVAAVAAVAADGHERVPGDGYRWPLPGSPAVVRAFDPPPHRFGRGHRGVDLAGTAGMPVLAAAGGTVLFAGPVAGRPVVSIRHGDRWRTTYEPVLPVVSPGDRVTAGQRIGTLQNGHPECAGPACLHWGLLRGDEYLDPLQLLSPGPLRLLPWDGERS